MVGFLKKGFLGLVCALLVGVLSVKPEEATTRAPKNWNFMVYMAANNSLYKFALQNFRQMIKVGSSQSINVLLQIDEFGEKEMTRFYIEPGNAQAVYSQAGTSECVSGTQESLFNFIRWGIRNYPAEHQSIVLWNHGSGIKDPNMWGRLLQEHRHHLFVLNAKTGRLELDRHMMRQKLAKLTKNQERGIAFNDTFETYLTNQDLYNVLDRVNRECLGGKKLDIVFMDACHMGMLEVGSQIKHAVQYMVASQEVEPGTGYDYTYLLAPFQSGTMSVEDFAKHAVTAYGHEYQGGYEDYTQSAVRLSTMPQFENNFTQLSSILVELLKSSDRAIFVRMLKELRTSASFTTEFYDADYIDLGHFYKSLFFKCEKLGMGKNWEDIRSRVGTLVTTMKNLALEGFTLLQNTVIENTAGGRVVNAHGLSIYFPINDLHNSYPKTVFDVSTHWSLFLKKYAETVRALKPVAKESHAVPAPAPAPVQVQAPAHA